MRAQSAAARALPGYEVAGEIAFSFEIER